MIRKFPYVKTFGAFGRFQWPASLQEFGKFNLLYGWNYSGKTTLSRVFRCFEHGNVHPDFFGAQAQMQTEDGAIHDLSFTTTAPFIRVFNSDFVRDNLAFDDCSTTPILILGAEDIAKQATLKERQKQRTELSDAKDANQKKKGDTKAAIEKALTKYSRDLIKNPLSIPNYDKTRFEPKVKECKDKPNEFVLDDASISQLSDVYRSSDKKPTIANKTNTLTAISHEHEKVASALKTVVTANRPIPRLAENPLIEKWVDQGRRLHDGKSECQFCSRPLPDDLLQNLADHFSEEYENLMNELTTILTELEAARSETVDLGHKSDFYPEFSERYALQTKAFRGLIHRRVMSLEILISAVKEKQTKALTACNCPDIDDSDIDIASALEAFNQIIAEHNKRTEEFEEKRQEALEKLEKHYAASFSIEEKYNERVKECTDLDATIESQRKQLQALDDDISALEQELSEAAKGAERINALLQAYFGKDDLKISVSDDKQFTINRGGDTAKNLSEGEKTAIAFAHFITRVQDGRIALSDLVVVIDDPVSSLDASHIFNTYALIKTQLATCKQLFVLTHSFEFYNLLKEWASDDENSKPDKWKNWRIFLIRRGDDGQSAIWKIPRELLLFKSEYHYLFSLLHRFAQSGKDDFDGILGLPNVVRRFMEAFGGIMIPLSTGLRGKMKRLFSDEVERERVWKFINYYSHNTTVTRSLAISDISECKAVVDACLKAVKQWDSDYFADLVSELGVEEIPADTTA